MRNQLTAGFKLLQLIKYLNNYAVVNCYVKSYKFNIGNSLFDFIICCNSESEQMKPGLFNV